MGLLHSKKNTAEDSEEVATTLLEAIDTLLHAVVVHSVATDPAAHAAFQAEMQKLRGAFRQSSPDGLALAAAHVRSALEGYNQQAVHFLRAHTRAQQKILSNLVETVTAISLASDRSGAILRDLERQVSMVVTVQDLTALAARFSTCLDSLRDQTLRQHERAYQNRTQPRGDVEIAPPLAVPVPPARANVDASGGPSLRILAERALDAALGSGRHGFVVALVVDRVHLINARFGYGVGDQILSLFRQHVVRYLNESDQLLRWTGPVFLVLLDRPSLDGVRTEFKRVTSTKLDITVQIGTRSVLLPVVTSFAAFSLVEADSTAALIEKIDLFVAEHWRR